jgi:hypothetical protein
MVSAIDVDTFQDDLRECDPVARNDSGEEFFGRANVCLAAPLSDVDWAEATCNVLTARILFNEAVIS